MRPLGAPGREKGEQPKSSTTNHSNFTNKISGGAGSVLPGIESETDGKAALNERSYRANRADRATGFPVGAPAGRAEQKKPCNRTERCADREVHATRATFSPSVLHHF